MFTSQKHAQPALSQGNGIFFESPVDVSHGSTSPHTVVGDQRQSLSQVAVGLVVVFCTNSINILAGVNGLEVGQTCILSSAVLIFNIARMAASPG